MRTMWKSDNAFCPEFSIFHNYIFSSIMSLIFDMYHSALLSEHFFNPFECVWSCNIAIVNMQKFWCPTVDVVIIIKCISLFIEYWIFFIKAIMWLWFAFILSWAFGCFVFWVVPKKTLWCLLWVNTQPEQYDLIVDVFLETSFGFVNTNSSPAVPEQQYCCMLISGNKCFPEKQFDICQFLLSDLWLFVSTLCLRWYVLLWHVCQSGLIVVNILYSQTVCEDTWDS